MNDDEIDKYSVGYVSQTSQENTLSQVYDYLFDVTMTDEVDLSSDGDL